MTFHNHVFCVFATKRRFPCQVNNDSGAGPVLCQRVVLDEDITTVKEENLLRLYCSIHFFLSHGYVIFRSPFLSRTKIDPLGSIVNWSNFHLWDVPSGTFMSKVPNCKIYPPWMKLTVRSNKNGWLVWINEFPFERSYFQGEKLSYSFREGMAVSQLSASGKFLVLGAPLFPGMASERMGSTWRACALWVLEPMIGRTLPLAQEMPPFDGCRLGWSRDGNFFGGGFQKVWFRANLDIGWSFFEENSINF